MRNDKHLAIEMRKRGKSYGKISKELDIPKSTLSGWFSALKWSRELKEELTRKANYVSRKRLLRVNKARQEGWEKWREEFRKAARKEFPRLLKNPLFVLGLGLYWGEGDHRLENGKVSLVNTDPKIIRLFGEFLRKVLGVPEEKIRAWLILYPDLSEKKCKNFWSEVSGVSLERFRKTQFIRGRHPTRRTTHGMCTIQVNSRGLKEKIFIWTGLLYERYNS